MRALSEVVATPHALKLAHQHCRVIARREAKNFYYAFRILPDHKNDAMCAIYAFMRRADDIADDESISIPARRTIMAEWLAGWRDPSNNDPVFVAVRDTQRRFQISNELLEELVRGTTMDLEPLPSDAAALQTFANFDDLYRYCYLVASVVGLVTIRIFGYSDPRAEKLAEETGIAFQLTNILRDVKEDAERGRVYLPEDRLSRFGLTPQQIVAATGAHSSHETTNPTAQKSTKSICTLLESLVADARRYYRASEELLPMIDADSRAALWVMTTIYSRLLDKISSQIANQISTQQTEPDAGQHANQIAERRWNLFGQRARVSTPEKLSILARGAIQSALNRLR